MDNNDSMVRGNFLAKQEAVFKQITKGSFGTTKMFMGSDGICFSCNVDIIPREIERGNDGSKLVTGCPLCFRTYCD
jgi:hypothetical protein